MLVIRLKRIGRTNDPQYRLVVQDSHNHPTSGRVVAYVGSYNPHTKATSLDTEKITFYLEHGAQPTPRVVGLLVANKVALPSWVSVATQQKRTIRNPDKLRKNQPKAEEAPAQEQAADTAVTEEVTTQVAEPAETKV